MPSQLKEIIQAYFQGGNSVGKTPEHLKADLETISKFFLEITENVGR